MTTQIEGPKRTFIAAGVLGRFTRVKLDGAGKLVLAGDTDVELGVTEEQVFATPVDKRVAVRLRTAEGTTIMVADAVIAAEAVVFTAASGEVSSTQGAGSRIGIALEAAGAAQDEIEILRD